MVEAVFQGQVVVRSEDTVVIEGNHYFPPGAVDGRCLHRSRMQTLCPWKGIASYYTVAVDGTAAGNAAWTYRHPSPLARSIKDHGAFRGNVTVRESHPE